MQLNALHLKVVLPSRTSFERSGVERIAVSTPRGLLQLPSQESNLIAAIVPGLAVWESDTKGRESVVIDQGILIKAGDHVVILTRDSAGEQQLELNLIMSPKNRSGLEGANLALIKMKRGFVDSIIQFTRPGESRIAAGLPGNTRGELDKTG